MKQFLLILIFSLGINAVNSIETKILHNIQNEIITNVDIKNEFKYLLALNNNLKNLDKEKIFTLSNESAIKETIKKIEVSKNYKEIKINNDYLEALLKNTYLNLKLKSLQEFEFYLKGYNLTIDDVSKKITIDALWNDLIVKKYTSQVTINRKKIKEKIVNGQKKITKEYQLSEIITEIKNSNEIQKKYKEIVNSINKIGFKNSASIYSFSDSAKIGGDIGWFRDSTIHDNIRKNIYKLKIGEITKPIILANGILILKVTDIKNSKIKIDYDLALKKAINFEKNRQLNQYSKIYFNKVKKNIGFNE